MVYLTPLSTVFQSYHGDRSHYSCLSWFLQALGWGSEVSCPRTFQRKAKRIQCGSNPGPLNYEAYTLPPSHAGPAKQKADRLGKFSMILNLYLATKTPTDRIKQTVVFKIISTFLSGVI